MPSSLAEALAAPRCRRGRGRRSRPPRAQAAANSRPGLEAAALEVGLDGDLGAARLLALQRLAARQVERGLARAARPPRASRLARARRTRARRGGRRWRARAPRRARAQTVAWPRRSGAASSTSSCTSVAMCTSSAAQAAISSSGRSRASGGAAIRTSRGRRRLPPAASVSRDARPTGSSASCAASRCSTAARNGRVRAPARVLTSCATAVTSTTSPTCSGDDAAGQQAVADVAHAGAVEGLAELVGAGEAAHRGGQVGVGAAAVEDLAERRDAAVEPERVEALQRPVRGPRDLEADDAPAGPHDARQLAQAGLGIGQVAQAEGDRRGGEGVVRERHRRRVAAHPLHRPRRPRPASCARRGAASRPRSRGRSPGRCARRRGPARARGRRCRSRRRARSRRARRRSRAPRSRASAGRGPRS